MLRGGFLVRLVFPSLISNFCGGVVNLGRLVSLTKIPYSP